LLDVLTNNHSRHLLLHGSHDVTSTKVIYIKTTVILCHSLFSNALPLVFTDFMIINPV